MYVSVCVRVCVGVGVEVSVCVCTEKVRLIEELPTLPTFADSDPEPNFDCDSGKPLVQRVNSIAQLV